MKKLYFHIVVILGLILSFSNNAHSTHVAGTDITYQCLGNDSFLITINVFRECTPTNATWTYPGIGVGFGGGTVTATSSCGQTINLSLPTTNVVNGNSAVGIDVSQLCPTAVSSCSGGTHPGMQLYTYQTIVVLSPPCNTWTIGYNAPCCRNTNQNMTTATGVFSWATLNSATDSCNSSPEFSTANPNPYACLGQLVCYDLGVTELDGDSLVYSFDTAYSAVGTQYLYNPLYSGVLPIIGITIDPATGKIQFTPTVAGNFVVVVKVCEYEYGTGLLKGCVRRDLQWVVNNCGNNAPAQLCSPNSIISFSGTGAQVSNNTVEVCYGQNFSFVILVTDSFGLNTTQYLTATSNVQQVLPGSQFIVVSNTAQDSLWVTVSWTATIGAAPFNTFSVNVSDNNCPVTAENSGLYVVKVIPSTYGGQDRFVCKDPGISEQLSAVGGTQFVWSVLAGGDTTSLSCDSCTSPIVTPQKTTDYEVTSDLSSSCKNIDTVRIWVSETYDLTMTHDTIICFDDSIIQLDVESSLIRNYSYEWWPKNKLDYDTAKSPVATPIYGTDFIVEVRSDSGCIVRDTMNVKVTPPFPKVMDVTTNNSLACSGLSTTLNLSLGAVPTSCGINNSACIGPTLVQTLGTQATTNGSTTFPAGYGNSFANTRQQFLILASELQNLGMTAGKLTSMSFNLTSVLGASTYYGYTIKMKCVSISSLTSWQTGLTTVFTPKAVNLSGAGWIIHDFDNMYDWDGVSNVVIDICFANPGLATNNSLTSMSTTTFNSSIYFGSNNQAACNANFLGAAPAMLRPNMKFEYCVTPDTNAYTYLWYPTTGLTDSTGLHPMATVTNSTTYNVIVTDSFDVCRDTADITLNIAQIFAGNDTSICPSDTLQLNAQATASCAGGGTYQWFPSTGLSNDTIPNPFVSINQTTTFVLSFTDNCGCTVTDTMTVFLGQVGNPSITRQDPNCGFDDGKYTFSASSGFSPFQFSIDGGITYHADSIFDNLAMGNYSLFLIDSLGCPSDTLLDTLFNLGAPTLDSSQINNVNCYNVPDGILTLFGSGGLAPLSYSIDSGITFQSSNIFSGLSEGTYQVVLQTADSCLNFATPFQVSQPTLMTYNFQAFDDTCFQLGNGYAVAMASGGTEPYNYNWGTGIPNDTINTLLLSGSYTLVITDSNSCSLDTTYVINEPNSVRINSVTTTASTCFGYNNGKIEISASGGDSLFRYSVDSGLTFFTSSIIDSLAPGKYDIIVADNSQCSVDSAATITEPQMVEITTNIDSVKICVDNCQTLSAAALGGNGGPYTFNWSPNLGQGSSHNVCPTENVQYVVYAYDPLQCVSELRKVQIKLYDSLQVFIPEDTFFCKGNALQLGAAAIGGDGSGFNYTWSPFIGLNNPKIPNPIANPENTTQYELTVTDNCGSPAVTQTIKITVNENPNVDFTLDKIDGCEPLKVILYNNSTNAYRCELNYGTGEIIEACGTAELEYATEGEYDIQLTVTSKDGCTRSIKRENIVEVYPRPMASYIMEPQPTTVLFPEINFTNLSEGNIVDIEWSFASFGGSDTSNPSFVFPDGDSATYPVRLLVTTDKGCVDDTIRQVTIGQEFVMFVPKAFSPNGDGLNETFTMGHTGVDANQFTLTVFDRWGKEVYRTQNKEEGWDGTNLQTGEPASEGLYVWKLIVGDYSNDRKRHEYIGNLMLIR